MQVIKGLGDGKIRKGGNERAKQTEESSVIMILQRIVSRGEL